MHSSRVNRFLILLIAITSMAVAQLSMASADEAAGLSELRQILSQSGVHHQFEAVAQIVSSETLARRAICSDSPQFSKALTNLLQQVLSAQRLTLRAETLLADYLPIADRRAALGWYQSASGLRIVKAEAQMPDEDTSAFTEISREVQTADNWTNQRRHLIRAVLQETKTPEFVAALNTTLDGVVARASSCTVDEFNAVELQLLSSKNDQPLLAAFMLDSLVLPTAVAFHDLSDDTLAEYWKYANSEHGKALHNALISVVWSVLTEAEDSLEGFLFESVD